jgi:hypothetical protein
MLDLQSLTTAKGAKIVVHMEDESGIVPLNRSFYQEGLELRMRQDLESNGIADTGPGTTVHILINAGGAAIPMSEADFKKWELQKDWFHSPLYKMLMRDNDGRFSGPTKDQFEKYRNNPAAITFNAEENCSLCLRMICPQRDASFDEAAMERAIANCCS